MKNLIFLVLTIALISCESTNNEGAENRIALPATPWRFTLDMNGDILPFNGTFSNVKKRSATLTLRNADEKIIIENVILRNDTSILSTLNLTMMF